MLAIAIRHSPDVPREVDRGLHVLQPLARCQAEHPADEGPVDPRWVVGRVRVTFSERANRRARSVRLRMLRGRSVCRDGAHD
jgi:hypothetical protein